MVRLSLLLRRFTRRPARPAGEATTPSPLPGKAALIVRLDGWTYTPLAQQLERSGWRVQVVDGGSAALNALARATPDLLVVTGPADKAGVQGSSRWVRIGRYQVPVNGDIIVAVDGTPTASLQDLMVYLESRSSVGQTVVLTVVRDGAELAIQVTVGDQTR